MAREVGDIAYELGIEPVYVVKDEAEVDRFRIIGSVIPESEIPSVSGLMYVIGIGDPRVREALASKYSCALTFTNLIHPSATFGRGQREGVEKGRGIIVAAGSRLTNGIIVGDFSIINQGACVAHDVIIDPFVHVAPGACISGNVHLKKACWIGAGAVINQGQLEQKLTIGQGAVVGSGAVVTRDCEANGVYVGVPARRIK